jgi:hypothetical protein
VGADRWDEQVGSVADEAARLLESLRRSAEPPGADAPASADAGAGPSPSARPSAPEAESGTEHPASEPGAHDPFCTWCPLCRTAEVVRSLSPETITRLADLATLAATVLADLASSRASADTSDAGAPPPRRPAPRPSASRPIPVRDADDLHSDDLHSDDLDSDDPQEAPRG